MKPLWYTVPIAKSMLWNSAKMINAGAPMILTTLTKGQHFLSPLLAAIAIIGTGREGLAFVVLSLRSTRRRCPSFVLILALRVYAERRAELNER
jgi:hypothetical protein